MTGITEELQREIDAYCAKEVAFSINGLPTTCRIYDAALDPRQAEIANLKIELEASRHESRTARKMAYAAKAERDAAILERDIALNALVEFVEKFINVPAPAEEDPAVRAVRVMQGQGIR